MTPTSASFKASFDAAVTTTAVGAALRKAALDGQLAPWTRHLTAACVSACEAMNLRASAKGHKLDLLPVSRSEYLSLDVVAFPAEGRRWRFPSLIAELENQQGFDFIAYSLWKVLLVRAGFRVLFCYRKQPEDAGELIGRLQAEVVTSLGIDGRESMTGETVVVVGSRGEASTFPYGFFAWWRLDTGTGRFYRM